MTSEQRPSTIALVMESPAQRSVLASGLRRGGARVLEIERVGDLETHTLRGVALVFADRDHPRLRALVQEVREAYDHRVDVVVLDTPGTSSSEASSPAATSSAPSGGEPSVAPGELVAVLQQLRALEAQVSAWAGGVSGEVVSGRVEPHTLTPAVEGWGVPLGAADASPMVADEVRIQSQDAAQGTVPEGPLETPMLDAGGANWRLVAIVAVLIASALLYLWVAPEPPLTEEERAEIVREQHADATRRALVLAEHLVDRSRLMASSTSNVLSANSCATLVQREAWSQALLPCARLYARDASSAHLYAEVLIASGELTRAKTLVRLRLVDAPDDPNAWYAYGRWATVSADAEAMTQAWTEFLGRESEGERADYARRQLEALSSDGGASEESSR